MIWAIGGLVVLFLLALKCKLSNNLYRNDDVKIINSPIAEALGQLVGISGGIYLALEMVINFVGLNDEIKIYVGESNLDMVAVAAILLACMQPVVVGILRKIAQK